MTSLKGPWKDQPDSLKGPWKQKCWWLYSTASTVEDDRVKYMVLTALYGLYRSGLSQYQPWHPWRIHTLTWSMLILQCVTEMTEVCVYLYANSSGFVCVRARVCVCFYECVPNIVTSLLLLSCLPSWDSCPLLWWFLLYSTISSWIPSRQPSILIEALWMVTWPKIWQVAQAES